MQCQSRICFGKCRRTIQKVALIRSIQKKRSNWPLRRWNESLKWLMKVNCSFSSQYRNRMWRFSPFFGNIPDSQASVTVNICPAFKHGSTATKGHQLVFTVRVCSSRSMPSEWRRTFGTTLTRCFCSIDNWSTARRIYSNAPTTYTRDAFSSTIVAYWIYPMAKCLA